MVYQGSRLRPLLLPGSVEGGGCLEVEAWGSELPLIALFDHVGVVCVEEVKVGGLRWQVG